MNKHVFAKIIHIYVFINERSMEGNYWNWYDWFPVVEKINEINNKLSIDI